jgi:proline racemase
MFVEHSLPKIKTSTILYPGRVDRSPCGTGTAAQLATLVAKGELQSNQELISESIIDGKFYTWVKDKIKCGERDAIIPVMRGRAWVYGKSQFFIDPNDPFLSGYTLSDTW